MAKLAIFLTLLYAAYARLSKEIPKYARGGAAYARQSYSSVQSTPYTWNAKIDNFNASDSSTFQQRYYINDQYWGKDPASPIFFEIGGEGTLSGPPGGYVATLGQQYSALLISLEHRFYGNSIPNNNFETANLKYLTVDQALADLASFTKWFTDAHNISKSAKWFVFGGSYPGALSSWYRFKYPEMSVGSLSSSGVVNCIVDYYQFDQQVSAAIGNECADQVKRINAAFERKISTPQGWQDALAQFQCENDMWTQDFFYMIADAWSMMDQYNSKALLCDTVLAVGEDASDEVLMQTFATLTNQFWGKDFCAGGFCKLIYHHHHHQ